MEEQGIILYDDEGNETLYEILFTFESDDYQKQYVILYPAGSFEDEEVELIAYSYEEDSDEVSGKLFPIESDEEWDMVEEVLNTFLAEE